VQECYCRLAQLPDVAHVAVPRAYLFTMARHILQRQVERARVVRIETASGIDGWEEEGDPLTPERFAQGRQELARVQAALAQLSDRARRIFIMRRVEGLSQKMIAQTLSSSERLVLSLHYGEGLTASEIADVMETQPKTVEEVLAGVRERITAARLAILDSICG